MPVKKAHEQVDYKELYELAEEQIAVMRDTITDLNRILEEADYALRLAYRALTEGMTEGRDPRCAKLRAEAKREIRRVLGMGEENAEAK